MSRLSIFNSPLMLGFEPFEQLVDRISKSAQDTYPPYNIAAAKSATMTSTATAEAGGVRASRADFASSRP